jgi:hypothetical protein
MNTAALASKFYTAMNSQDFKTIATMYSSNAQFSDPVFPSLTGDEAKAMWHMLLQGAKNFSVEHQVLNSGPDFAEIHWIAKYNFSKTGRPVVNNIHTRMSFQDNLIVSQKDDFPVYAWAKQALGLPGYALGWTSFMHKKIQATAKGNLSKFMDRHEE